MKKNKKKKIVFAILLILLVVTILPVYNSVNKIISHSSKFYDDNELEERNISEIYDTMYATLLDGKATVVSTNNPDTEVAAAYRFTETTAPQTVFKPNTNGFILLEFNNSNGDKSDLISTDIIYRLELSEYIVPIRYYDESQASSCTEFIQKGEAYACGGIYKENDKYVFKIKFKDTQNRTEIKTSYQFSMKLSDSLNEKTVNIVNLPFEQYQTLPIFFQVPAANESDRYSLFVENNPDSYNDYNNFTVTIRNNMKDGKPFKGYLEINLGDYLAIEFDNNNRITPIKFGTTGSFNYGVYNSSCGDDYCFTDGDSSHFSIRYSKLEGIKNDANYSGIANKLVLDLGKNEQYNILNDITDNEITFEFVVTSYFISNGSSNIVFKYHDNYDDIDYNQSKIVSYSLQYSYPSVSYQISNSNSYGVPKKITYNVNETVYNSNYIGITDSYVSPSTSDISRKSLLQYYLPASIFACEEGGPTIRARIDYSDVEFDNCHHSISSIKDEDPITYAQLKALDSDLVDYLTEHPNSNFEVIKSKQTNSAGEYYYIVLSNSTYFNMYPDGNNLYDKYSNNLYLNNTSNNDNPGTFTIRLFNVREKNVQLYFDYYLENAKVESGYGKYVGKHMYTTNVGGYSYSSTANPNVSISSTALYPYTTSVERLNNGYFKWNFSFNEDTLGFSLNEYKTLFEDVYIMVDSSNDIGLNELSFYNGTKVITADLNNHGVLYVDNNLIDYTIAANEIATSDIKSFYNLSDNTKIYKVKLLDLINADNKLNFSIITLATNANTDRSYEVRPVLLFTSKSLMNHSLDSNINTTSGDLKSTHLFGGSYTYNYPSILGNTVSTSYSDAKVIKEWEFEVYPVSTYSGEIGLMTHSQDTDGNPKIIADNTKLEGIKIVSFSDTLGNIASNDLIPITSFNETSNNTLEYCFDDYHCFYLNKDENNSLFGRTLVLKGTQDFNDLIIRFVSSVDLDNINISGEELNGMVVSATMDLNNYLNENTEVMSGASLDTNYSLSAELSVEKSSEFYSSLSSHNEVTTVVGKSPTSDLYIIDFMDGYDNGTRNENNNVVFNNLKSDIEGLTDLRKRFDVVDLEIYVKVGEESNEELIYSNGNFIDSYSSSTLNITNDDNRLYTLHLVKSDGSDLSKYTAVRITYNLDVIINGENSIRNSDTYGSEKIKITSNVKAIRRYGNNSNVPSTELEVTNDLASGVFNNRIDGTNSLLICYASSNFGEIEATYLTLPDLAKSLSNNTWTIIYNTNNAGKLSTFNVSLADNIVPVLTGNTSSTNEIKKIIIQNTELTDLKVSYTNLQGQTVTINNGPDSWTTVNLTNQIIGTISNSKIISDEDSRIQIGIDINSVTFSNRVAISYKFSIDYEKLYSDLVNANLITSDFKYYDNTSSTFLFKFSNEVVDLSGRVEGGKKSSSSGNISLGNEIIGVQKTVSNMGTTSTWKSSFKTGTLNSPITVEETYSFGSSSNAVLGAELEKIKANTALKDLSIKINGEEIYSSGNIKDGWNNNLSITFKPDGFKVELKDNETNEFIANDTDVSITYSTELNKDDYHTNLSYLNYYIDDVVVLKKNTLTASQSRRASYSSSASPSISKQYLGNDNSKLSVTNWKITATTGAYGRETFEIYDTDVYLGYQYGDYLSISNMKISLNNEVIYDSANNINAGGFDILDQEGNPFVINKDGSYLFAIKFQNIDHNSTVVVEYSYSINREKFISDGNSTNINNSMLLRNRARIVSGSYTLYTSYIYGYFRVIPKFTKVLDTVSSNYNGSKNVSWKIYVNLSEYYNLDDLTDKIVKVRDALPNFLNYSSVYVRSYRSGSSSYTTLVKDVDYILTVEDKLVEIRIVNPKVNPNVEIVLNTECLASVDKISNNASLIIDDIPEDEIGATLDTKLFTPYVYGVITSLGKVTYNIRGEKLLDGALSSKPFAFSLKEVDSEGNEIENGIYFENANDDNGQIVFNGIEYSTEGVHYYKIKEIAEEENYEYDNTEYTVKLTVEREDDQLVVTDISLMDDKEKIEFNNKTIIIEPDPTIIDVPDTGRKGIIIAIVTILISSVVLFKIIKRKKYIE